MTKAQALAAMLEGFQSLGSVTQKAEAGIAKLAYSFEPIAMSAAEILALPLEPLDPAVEASANQVIQQQLAMPPGVFLASGYSAPLAQHNWHGRSGWWSLSLKSWMPKSDATTWVTRDRETGQPRMIKVVDMSNAHLWRWIRYFRRKWRTEEGFKGEDKQLDLLIQAAIVTAPAIYREAAKRGVISGITLLADEPPRGSQATAATTMMEALTEPGKRLITLEDD